MSEKKTWKNIVSRTEVLEYAATLDPKLKEIHETAMYLARDLDTGLDDFQIAAEVEEVFQRYAERAIRREKGEL